MVNNKNVFNSVLMITRVKSSQFYLCSQKSHSKVEKASQVKKNTLKQGEKNIITDIFKKTFI